MRFYFLLTILTLNILSGNTVYSQSLGDVKGYVVEAKTGLPIIGATVRLSDTEFGAITNNEGFFQIQKVPTKTYNIEARFLGFNTVVKYNVLVKSAGNIALNFSMEESTNELDEFVITQTPFIKKAESPNSINGLSREEIATYPGGNNDVAKVVQSLPGVSGSVGFRNDIIIRGGGPSENVYYLDGIEIPNINHFATQGSAGGPVGMVNVSFIEDVSLSTSAFGANVDNALSGVVQFNQRNGDQQKRNYNFRLGASEAAFTIGGPFVKPKDGSSAKTTFIASVRRSYLQYLFKVIDLPFLPDYIDYQYKVNHKINNKHEISLIGLGSIDDFKINEPEDITEEQKATLDQIAIIQQKTNTVGVSWKYNFKDGQLRTTFSNNQLQNNLEQYLDNINKEGLYFSNDSKETQTTFKVEALKFLDDNSSLTFGTIVQKNNYENETFSIESLNQFESKIDFWRYGLFSQFSTSSFNNKLNTSFGFRMDGDSYTEFGGNIFNSFSPRIAFSYSLSDKLSINASAGIYYKIPPMTVLGYQDRNGALVNQIVKYIRSDHLVAGLAFEPKNDTRITLEGFHKKYSNYPVSIKDGVSLANLGGDFGVFGSEDVSSVGNGRAYGLELFYQKKLSKRIYGTVAYTLFWSEYSGLDKNDFKPAIWDNRHLLSVTGGYKFGNNWELGLRYRYLGEAPFVKVNEVATEIVYPIIVNDYTNLGDERLIAYSVTDIRLDKKWNFSGWSLDLFLDITNLFGSEVPRAPQYGLELDNNGEEVIPKNLIQIEDLNQSGLLPTFGVVIDF